VVTISFAIFPTPNGLFFVNRGSRCLPPRSAGM